MDDIFKVHNLDARKLKSVIKDKIVDVTITSPPYFDLKDYGSKKQIGFGQEYQKYLNDLKTVFEGVYEVTKETGTLWVVIDTFKRDGILIPLPFDFADKIADVGWKLQEVIIWGKDRTVPWTHKGQMRKMFEYILVFSKNKEYNFFIDEIRNFQSLKKWWIRYPERYNPKGKTPEAIWNYKIPLQGAWGKGYIRHFCPLPEPMMEQIIKLTTREDDVVLDCFSGSGTVLFKADTMKRRYIGFDLNQDYIEMFNNYLKKMGRQKRSEYELAKESSWNQKKFEKLILELRALKYARVLFKKLKELEVQGVEKIYVAKSASRPKAKNSLMVIDYLILLNSHGQKKHILKNIKNLSLVSPLSGFGIEPVFSFVENVRDFMAIIESENLFVYNIQATHRFQDKILTEDLPKFMGTQMILSEIFVNIDEKEYEQKNL